MKIVFLSISYDVYNRRRIIMSVRGSLPTGIWYTYTAHYFAKNVIKTTTWWDIQWYSNRCRQSLRLKWDIQPIVWELLVQTDWGNARVDSGQYSSTDTNPYLMPLRKICMILRYSNASQLPTHALHLDWLPFYGHTVDWVSLGLTVYQNVRSWMTISGRDGLCAGQ